MLRALVLLMLLDGGIISAAEGDRIIGTWVSGDGKAHIAIAAVKATYQGTISWLGSPKDDQGRVRVDALNPDPGKRTQPIVGLCILTALVATSPTYFDQGSIYDPESGSSYHCHATLSDDGTSLVLRGYVGISLFGRSETWTRLPAPAK